MGVLVVSDNELDMGDDEVASSEVAEVVKHVRKSRGRGSGKPAPDSRGWEDRWSPKTPYFEL